MRNKKLLYVNGCSHSCGAEISYPKSFRESNDLSRSWGGRIADHYGLVHHNDAVSGQSNYGIHTTTINSVLELLDKYSPDEIIVMIGWTSFDRAEIVYNNRLYRVGPSCDLRPSFKQWPLEVREAFKNFILLNDYENGSMNSFSLIYYNTINFLKLHGIDYFFFNSIQGMVRPKVNLLHQLNNNRPTNSIFDQISRDKNYFYPFDDDMTYYHHLKSRFDCFYEGRNHHFLEDAHQYWSELLINRLDQLYR